MLPQAPAPGRLPSGRRFGAGLFLCFALALGACEPADDAPDSFELGDRTVDLEAGASLHTVVLGMGDGGGVIDPDTVRARPGDAVRFVAGDDRGHSVAFERSALSSSAARFLERTDQMRGAPLVRQRAGWVVDLREAPPGTYPFECLNTGARGVLIIVSDERG